MSELNKRNTETVKQALDELYAMNYRQVEMINQLNNGMSTLQNRLNVLEQQLIIQKVQLTGLGPSTRE